jgi:predicted phosphodiesterase
VDVVISDIHCPFQDKPLINAILKFIADSNPERLIIAGDLIDFYSISPFDRCLERAENMQYELDEARMILKNFKDAANDMKIFLILGNHEDRFEKYLNRKAPALRGLRDLTIERQLSMPEMNITLVPYIYEIMPGFIIKHGESVGRYPARGEYNKEFCNGISGHGHKTDICRSYSYKNDRGWYSIGHLANKSIIDKHYSKACRWSQSFAIIDYKYKYVADMVEIIECNEKGFYIKSKDNFYEKKI